MKILAFTLLLMVLLSTFAAIPHVEAAVCNFNNVGMKYPTVLHATETFQVLVRLTAGCDYYGGFVLRVDLVDERTNQIISTTRWTWFRYYDSTVVVVSPWLQLKATAPNTAGYWPLTVYAYNLNGERSTSITPFQIQVL
jgi:hypothetical protein